MIGLWVPREADGVAHPTREHFLPGAVRVHARDDRVTGLVADIARGTDRHVQLSVGTEGNVSPPVMAILRQIIAHHRRLRWVVQRIFDPVEAQYAVDLRDIKRAV